MEVLSNITIFSYFFRSITIPLRFTSRLIQQFDDRELQLFSQTLMLDPFIDKQNNCNYEILHSFRHEVRILLHFERKVSDIVTIDEQASSSIKANEILKTTKKLT